MALADVMRNSRQHRILLGGRSVDYRLVESNTPGKLRVRVGVGGMAVMQPANRTSQEVSEFLLANQEWILDQLDRAARLQTLRRPLRRAASQIRYRGEPTPVRIEPTLSRSAGNRVRLLDGAIVVSRGPRSQTSVTRSLERWLRREARLAIEDSLSRITARLRQLPTRIYVMGQRTKWGNCSSQRNLSFNWRLILAPDYVLRYIVTHEAVHLAIPDHSRKFWLTVQSHCPDTERARRWLVAHASDLAVDLRTTGVE